MAYVRKPSPCDFFLDTVTTHQENLAPTVDSEVELSPLSDAVSDITQTSAAAEIPFPTNTNTRPKRHIQKPRRFRDTDHVDPLAFDTSSMSSDDHVYHKVKRILAQRECNGTKEFLAHLVGEPAQQAICVPISRLNTKTQR